MPSQTVPQHLRKKTFKPRTSSGCKTCKIRRIKCDETEPACKACVRGRRTCDGYPAKAQVHQQEVAPAKTITPPPSPPLFSASGEHRSYDFFRHYTLPRLAGSFASPIWSRLLLQAIYNEPAIRHAAVALGSLHEDFELRHSNSSNSHGDFPLKQYLKAIGHITAPNLTASKSSDVYLISCVLFVCFEVSIL
jgi:hypothetical protein